MSIKLVVNSDDKLNFDLYHLTSTLFLDSIVQNGLGAINPVREWNILDLFYAMAFKTDGFAVKK
jgi:hypothetical protein